MSIDPNKLPYENGATAVGLLAAIDVKTFDTKKAGQMRVLEAQIKAAGSTIRASVFATRKRPTLIDDLIRKFAVNTRVSTTGSLQEQVGQDGKLFRGIQAWGLGEVLDAEEDRIVYHVAGNLGNPEIDSNGVYVVPVTVVRQITLADGETKEQEDTFRLWLPDDHLKLLYSKVSQQRIIRARGDVINRVERDRFGVADGYIARLEVAMLEAWDDQHKMWLPVFKAGQTAPASQPATSAAAPPATPTGVPAGRPIEPPPAAGDDVDVPF